MNHALFFSLTGKRWERNPWCHRVATFLRKHDWDAEVIDFAFFWKLEELQEFVKSRTTSNTVMFVFGTAFLNPWSPYFNEFIAWLKNTYPHIPRVVGGQNALVTAAEHIDYWVDSYGEHSILKLAQKLLGTNTDPIVFDSKFFGTKKVVRSLNDMSNIHLDNYLLDFEVRDYIQPTECIQFETARGCMFSCSYCNFPIIGQTKDVSVSKQAFKHQLQTGYEKWGLVNWRVIDETFNDRPEKIIKYAEAVDELGYNPWICGFARGDLVVKHKEYWDYYIRLGFLGHSMGIETFNRKAGKLIRKGMDPDALRQGLIEFEKYTDIHAPKRYRANIQLICGIPGEDISSWYDSVKWLNTHWLRQSASAWILEVSDYDENLTNMSRFTKDLINSGLRKISENIDNPGYHVYKDINGNVIFKSIQGGGVGTTRLKNIVVWEHDDMNWYQAEHLVKEFYDPEKGYKGRRGGNPFLSDRLFPYFDTTQYEDVYDEYISKVPTDDIKFKNIVQRYIDNKLSWKPNV